MVAQFNQVHYANMREALFALLIYTLAKAPVFSSVSDVRQTTPSTTFSISPMCRAFSCQCFCSKTAQDGIFTKGLAAGNEGVRCSKRPAGAVSYIQQIDDIRGGLIVEYRHADNKPDHTFKELTQRHCIREDKVLLN